MEACGNHGRLLGHYPDFSKDPKCTPPQRKKDLITTLGNLEEYREVHFLDPLGGVGSFSIPSASEVFSIKPVLTGTGTIR